MTKPDNNRPHGAVPDAFGLRVGYMIPEFPGVTHVLFWREIVRLRTAGAAVHLISTVRPEGSCPHAFRTEPCAYIWPVGPAALVGIPSPVRLMRQIAFALRLPEGGWRERLKVLAMLPSAWTLSAWARQHDLDHLHVHSFANSAYVAALASIGSDLPYSMVLHGDRPVYGLNHPAKLSCAAFAGAIDAITRSQIEEASPGVCLNALMTCGVPLDRYVPAPREPSPVLRMISVTRLNHCKGIVFCLEAVAALRRSGIEVRYTLVGDGPDAEEIRDRTATLGIADLIEFLPGAPEDEIVRLYHRHDIAVLTSHGIGEITATSIREAMSTGMPVIMSDIGAARTMVDPGVTGVIVPQRDVAAIADAIRWFATNLDRIPQMGAAARDKAERDFCDAVPVRVLVGELRCRTRAGVGVPAQAGAAVSAS